MPASLTPLANAFCRAHGSVWDMYKGHARVAMAHQSAMLIHGHASGFHRLTLLSKMCHDRHAARQRATNAADMYGRRKETFDWFGRLSSRFARPAPTK
jgi:hypothetical protein